MTRTPTCVGVFEIRPANGPIYLSGNGRRTIGNAFVRVLASLGRRPSPSSRTQSFRDVGRP